MRFGADGIRQIGVRPKVRVQASFQLPAMGVPSPREIDFLRDTRRIAGSSTRHEPTESRQLRM